MSTEFKKILPESSLSNPHRHLSSVVLPLPLGPVIATISPGSKYKLNSENNNLKNIIKKQIDEINQNKLDQSELEFLKLNFLYSSKCQKTAFKKGYKIGTPEYRKCILNRGKKN